MRIGVLSAYLLACLWVRPSHAETGSRLKVSLSRFAVLDQAVSKADANTMTERFRAGLARSTAFVVVDPASADFSIAGRISQQDTTYLLRIEVQSLKTQKSTTLEARYNTSSDFLSDFIKNLPGLVGNRLTQSVSELHSIGKKNHKGLYFVVGVLVAGGAAGVAISMQGKNNTGTVNPPPPSGPGSVILTVNVP